MAVAKARLLEPLKSGTMPINREALVIGAAGRDDRSPRPCRQGFVTHLIEKENELGGNLKKIRHLMNGTILRSAGRIGEKGPGKWQHKAISRNPDKESGRLARRYTTIVTKTAPRRRSATGWS